MSKTESPLAESNSGLAESIHERLEGNFLEALDADRLLAMFFADPVTPQVQAPLNDTVINTGVPATPANIIPDYIPGLNDMAA